jgi:hypothetical protein
MTKYVIPYVEHSGKVARVSVPVADDATDPQLNSIFAAVNAVTLGNAGQSYLSQQINKSAGSNAAPDNGYAQKEIRWLVRYTDNTTAEKFRFEIPTADGSLLTGNGGTDILPLGAGAGAALKSAIEAAGRSPNGNAITVSSVELVGRNS